jgi:hypothetical protein
MNSITGKNLSLLLTVCFGLTLITNPGVLAQSSEPGIEVGNQTVAKSKIQKRIDQQMKRMEMRAGSKLKKNPKMKERLKKRIKQGVIDQYVKRLVLLDHAKKAGITVSDEKVEKRFSEVKQQLAKSKKTSFKKMLKKSDRSEDELKTKLKERMIVQEFIKQNLPEITVSDSEARDFYDKNSKRLGKQSFSKLKPRIVDMLENEKRKKELDKLVSKLKKETTININV